jgi:PAS domain-containing protein
MVAFRKRSSPGGTSFALMMSAVVIWSLMASFAAAADGFQGKIMFAKLSYLGNASVAPFFLVFALRYSGWRGRITPVRMMLLWVIPVITIALAATNELHGLVWSSFGQITVAGETVLIYGHGLWYWISVVYYVSVVLTGTVVLARFAFRSQRLYALQTVVLLTGVALPWIGEAIYLSAANPFPGLNFPVIGFALTGALLIFGISRFKLFDIMPVAHAALLERMNDGLLVMDEKGRIVDVNLAAQAILGIGPQAIGLSALEALPILRPSLALAEGKEDFQVETPLPAADPTWYDLRISALRGRRGKLGGRMVILRNITERKQAENEKEWLIKELLAAMADIKVLRGLLPVCVNCRKIRDDKGYWSNIEQYVEEHSEAQFSHGLCDECMKKLYPDYVKDAEGEGEGSGGR